MLAVWRRAAHDGRNKIRLAPAADAIIRIGRDIGRVESAERRFEPQPAAERAISPRRGRVTGCATARIEHLAAIREIWVYGTERARGDRFWRRDDPCNRHADASQKCDDRDKPAHRSTPSFRTSRMRD